MYLQRSSPCDGAGIRTQTHTENTLTVAAAAGGRARWRRRSLIKVSKGTQQVCGRELECAHGVCIVSAAGHRTTALSSGCLGPAPPSVALWSRSSPQAAPTSDPCNETAIHYAFQARAFVSGRFLPFPPLPADPADTPHTVPKRLTVYWCSQHSTWQIELSPISFF